jgi:uncharacterized protein (DUF433 family)
VPYPLAHRRPYIADRKLLLEAQTAAGLDADFCLVAEVSGQLILTPPRSSSLSGLTGMTTWRLAGGRMKTAARPVRMTPGIRFGRPAVRGISTDVLWEHNAAGEDVDELAEAFNLVPDDVRWAIAYETSQRAA